MPLGNLSCLSGVRTLRGVFIAMFDKIPATIDVQIAILKSRGLSIPDENRAKSFLLRNNYYRVSGYTLTLRHGDVFIENTSFQDIEDIYSFDLELRHMLLKYLEIIETTLKSVYAYEIAHIHGPIGYLDPNNFSDANEYSTIMKKAEKQRNSRMAHAAYLEHLGKDWKDISVWAFVDFLTISDISFLYKISESQIKRTVAEHMNLRVQGDTLLEKFMHSMTIIRNLCAHGSRLYDCVFGQRPKLSKKEMALLMKNADGTVDNARLYGFVIIMKRLLAGDQFAMLKEQLAALSAKYPCVNMEYYGFRNDWKTQL